MKAIQKMTSLSTGWSRICNGIARTVRVSRNRVISVILKKEIQPVASDVIK